MELLIAVSETVSVSVFRVSMQKFLPFVYTCTVPQTDAVSGKLNCIPSSGSSCCKFLLDMVAVEFHKVPHHFTNTLRIHRLLSAPMSLFFLYLHLQLHNLPSLSLQPRFLIYLFLLPPICHLPSTSHVFFFFLLLHD